MIKTLCDFCGKETEKVFSASTAAEGAVPAIDQMVEFEPPLHYRETRNVDPRPVLLRVEAFVSCSKPDGVSPAHVCSGCIAAIVGRAVYGPPTQAAPGTYSNG